VRAIVTAERAQALGFLNTPKDNMNLVSLYLLANQFTKGTELLYNGMKKKTIESEPHNWRILGRYYQEANLNDKAVEVLKEATGLFPKNGELEVQIAQIYLQMEKTKEAFEHAKAAIAKGNFEGTKPYGVHYLVAYTAYELGRIDDANKALSDAEKFEEHKKDPQFARLKEVVVEAVAEREAKSKAKEEPKKGATPAPAAKKTASNR
jgi:tetratricopeptide (TPR) repeat protein